MCRLLFPILFWAFTVSAQAEGVQVSSSMAWPAVVSDQAQVLEGVDPDFQFADVREQSGKLGSAFEPVAGKPIRLANDDAVAWLRLRLHNSEASPLSLRLVLGEARVRRVDFYVEHGDAVHHSATGSSVPIAEQKWSGRDAGVELIVPAQGDVTVYARLQSDQAVGLTPKLYSPGAYSEREHRAALWDGALIGGLMALAWSALLIGIFSRNRQFFWLASLCVAVALYEATYRGYSQMYLWPGASEWGSRANEVVGKSSSVFFALFVLGVAAHENIRLPLRRLFIALTVVQGASGLCAAFGPYRIVAATGSYAAIAFYALGLVMAIYLMRRTAPSARLMVIVMAFALFNMGLRKAQALGLASGFVTHLGMDIHPNPVIALVGLATNLAVLTAWIHRIAAQRSGACNKLVEWQQQEQQRLRDEVERQTKSLNQALEYAEEKNRQRVQMLSYIAHDLRAPLATIAGYIKLLSDAPTPAHEAHIQTIDRSIGYQVALIDDLLEFAREDQQPLRILPAETDLSALLRDIGNYAAALAAQRANRFVLEAYSPLPSCVCVDARRLQQVLLNLLSNAAKYTHSGDICLRVNVDHTSRNCRLRFSVTDTGIGIDLSQKASLFEAYKQLQRGHGGVGLGLVIVQRILEGMGSSLCVQSTVGRGSVFSFELDVKQIGERTIPAGILREESGVALPATEEGATVPPDHLRQHLASLARSGQLSDIEEWLSLNSECVAKYRAYFTEFQKLLQELDLDGIVRLALSAPHGDEAAAKHEPHAPEPHKSTESAHFCQ